ncbi:MAG TPA: mechanosensitive ion channel family protein, partial [Candidatus Saccharimonadales bacterium]|nr:mechanosensitive ion channel family protein [Candidatus Saccharimonadales bacterium]
IMRRFTRALSRRADKAENLKDVNRLRRIETLTILSIAVIRAVLVILALYFWWIYSSPGQQPTAIIGATTVAIIVGGATVGPLLRDVAYGGVMMAEHWFGVGDYIKVEPFAELEGIVERVTLRSIRIRGINGEVIWLNNQNIAGVRVSPKGVRTIAIDLFVTDLQKGLDMIEAVNLRLPPGSLMVVRPLHIMTKNQLSNKLWHLTVIGETAPGREWLLEKYAIQIMQEQNELHKKKLLATDPIARYADSDAERRFARTIQNARKSSLAKRRLPLPESLANQITKPLGKKSPNTKRKPNKKIQ